MQKVGKEVNIIDNVIVLFLPYLSPKYPKTNPPKGFVKKPTANVDKLARIEKFMFCDGKKVEDKIKEKKP